MNTDNVEELKGLAKRVLEDAFVMSLGTHDSGGVWVSDVIYIHEDNFDIYWVSFPHVRHSKAIQEDSMVACTITASWIPDDERALQIAGKAEKIEGEMPELVARLHHKCGETLPDRAEEIMKSGRVWYHLTPQKIELHYSKLFGYEKQTITLS